MSGSLDRLRVRLATHMRHLHRARAGIAAVEFALILPLMLLLYLGLVEMSRGLRASQKVDLVAHMLADLAAQQLTGGSASGQAGLANADFQSIFSAATLVMSPLSTTNMQMTISQVTITSPSAGSWQAATSWSVTVNGGTRRSCGTLTAGNPPPVSLTTIPPSYVQITNGVSPVTGSIIVADVIYPFNAGVHYEFYKWKSAPTINMSRTSYAAVRNNYTPNDIQFRSDLGPITGGAACP